MTISHPGQFYSHNKFSIYNVESIYDNILNQKLYRKNKLPATHPGQFYSDNKLPVNIHQKETAHG